MSSSNVGPTGILNTLYNKYNGYAYTGLDISSEYQVNSSPYIYYKNIFSEEIPKTAPNVDTNFSDFKYKKLDVDNFSTVRYKVSLKGVVTKYERVPLIGTGNVDVSFIFRGFDKDDTSKKLDNVLTQAIPSNFDPLGSYKIKLYRHDVFTDNFAKTEAEIDSLYKIPEDKYIFDRDAGIITFYNYKLFVNQNNPPVITFWRYEGKLGSSSAIGDGATGHTGPQGDPGVAGSQGIQGDTGVTGPAGDKYNTKTTTDIVFQPTENTSKTFTVLAGLAYIAGNSVVIVDPDSSDGSVRCEGTVSNYLGTELTVANIINIKGDFVSSAKKYNINLDGIDGPQGIQGIQGIKGDTGHTGPSGDKYNTKTTTDIVFQPTENTSKTFTVPVDLAYIAGNSVVIVDPDSSDGSVRCEGTVSSYSGTLLTVANIINIKGDFVSSAKKYNINLDGIDGPQGIQGHTGHTGPSLPIQNTSSQYSLLSSNDSTGMSVWSNSGLKFTPTEVTGITGTLAITGDATISGKLNNNSFDNTYFIDWIKNNLGSKPGVVTKVQNSDSADSNATLISINNPTQLAFGNIYVPYIEKVSIVIKNPSGSDVPVLTGNDSTLYLPKTVNEITTIKLAKTGTQGFSNGVYTYVNSNLDNFKISSGDNIGKIEVVVTYDNSKISGSANSISLFLTATQTASPPGAPTGLSASSEASYSATINWGTPSTPSGSVISSYKINYTPVSASKRYDQVLGPGYAYNTIPNSTGDITGTNSYGLASLYPGTIYNYTVQAKNNIFNSYGPQSSLSNFTTLLPSAPSVPNASILTPNFGYSSAGYISILKTVGTNTIVTGNKVYKFGDTNYTTLNAFSSLPIHTSTNAGSTGSNLMSVTCNIDSDVKNTISFEGFPSGTSSETDSTNISFDKVISDNGGTSTSQNSGFYQLVNLTPKFKPNSNFSAQTTGYTVNFVYKNVDNTTGIVGGSDTFYIDDLSTTPGLVLNVASAVTSHTLVERTTPVTGVTVYGANSPQSFNYSVNAQNFARNFYNSNLLTLSSSKFTINNFVLNTPTMSAPLASNTNVNLTGSFNITFGTSDYSNGIPLTFTLNSALSGTSNQSSDTYSKLVDALTYNKSLPTSAAITGSSSANTVGFRVKSNNVESSSISTKLDDYDNTKNLVSDSGYDIELPIIKGLYVTRANYSNELGYANYSNLNTETNFRYATFCWTIPKTLGQLSTLNFKIKKFNHNNNVSYSSINSSISSEVYTAYYRLERLDSSNNPIAPSIDNYSTYWIDANKLNDNTANQYYNSTYKLKGLLSVSDENMTNNSGSDFTYNVWNKAVSPTAALNTGESIRVYFRIGIQMDKNITFEEVQCNYY